MGYRLRLGRFPKHKHKKYKHFKSEEEAQEWFEKHDSRHAHYRPQEHQDLIELGKYVDYRRKDLEVEEFYDFELVENDFVIVGKEFLLHVIEEYRKNTEEWYRELHNSFKEGTTGEVEMHLKNKVAEWDKTYLNHLKTEPNEDGQGEDGRLTSSWKFEYAVFNLLFILHTFDWDNDYLIYSGW